MKEETWDTFLESGMLWFINRLLHAFGWVIVLVYADDGTLERAYPARTTMIGFSLETDVEKREIFMKNVGPMRVPAVTAVEELPEDDQARIDRVLSYTADPE